MCVPASTANPKFYAYLAAWTKHRQRLMDEGMREVDATLAARDLAHHEVYVEQQVETNPEPSSKSP